jgi:hypothetical protein
MLKEFLDFERDPALLAEFEEVATCYSAIPHRGEASLRQPPARHAASKPQPDQAISAAFSTTYNHINCGVVLAIIVGQRERCSPS